MGKNKCMAVLAACLMLVGCGKQIPDDIIQPDKMEEVLYDYHLSVSMSNKLRGGEAYMKKAFQDYVFQKHGVTEAEFDSSMVWYTRHTAELAEIYSRLKDRYEKEESRVSGFLDARNQNKFVFQSGDTVDAWPFRKLYWLTHSPLENQFVFEINPDTTFYPKDSFVWKANYTFLKAGQAVMAMNVVYDNDSVVGKSQLISGSGADSLSLYSDSAFHVKTINGYIYLLKDSVRKPVLLVNDLKLMKFHQMSDSISVRDSAAAQVNGVDMKPKPEMDADVLNKPVRLKKVNPAD